MAKTAVLNPRPPFLLRGAFLAALLAIFLVVGGVMSAAWGYQQIYAGRMFPGVEILGVPMGGKTVAQARELAVARAETILAHPITFIYPDQDHDTVTLRALGLTLSPDQLVTEAFTRGRSGSVLDQWSEIVLLRGSGAVFAFSPDFDTDRMLASLEASLVTHEQAPEDAKLAFVNGELQVVAERTGIRIDRAQLAILLEEAFQNLDLPDRIEVPIDVVAPQIRARELEPFPLLAKHLTDVPLTIKAQERMFTVASKTLIEWLVASSSEGPVEFAWSKEAMTTYLGTIAKKIDQPMRPRKINEQNGSVLDVGAVGFKLDREAAVTAMLAALDKRFRVGSLDTIESVTIDLAVNEVPIEEKTVTPPFTPGLYEGKYLEVNLKEQTLYQWEGTNLVASYPVSTGKWSSPTPEGVLYIKNHISYAYSRKYDLYMPWWLGLAFNPDGSNYQGYGIHELPEWRGGRKEGQAHLGTPVSHGCIRLGIGPAQAIYDWAEEGMPAYIHK